MRIATGVLLLIILVAGCDRSEPVRSQPALLINKDAPPPQPAMIEQTRFSAWGLSCEEAQDVMQMASNKCIISQLVTTDPKSGRVVLGVTVDYLNSPAVATIRFRFSPTAKVAPGIGIKIDESTEMRLPVSDCNPRRCEASGRLKPEVLKLWRSGRIAQFAFFAENDRQVTLPISLEGFDMAMVALKERYRAAAEEGSPQNSEFRVR
jgi:invasion protein IalB